MNHTGLDAGVCHGGSLAEWFIICHTSKGHGVRAVVLAGGPAQDPGEVLIEDEQDIIHTSLLCFRIG